jgi:hypothetical protein
MRSALLVSVATHAGLAGLVLLVLARPQPFEATSERTIAVDLMTPQEAEEETRQQQAASKPERQADAQAELPTATAKAAPDREQEAAPAHESPRDQRREQPQDAAANESADRALPTIEAGEVLAAYQLQVPEIDARKPVPAGLTAREVSEFKLHLRKCWRLPGGVAASSTTRVVMRVPLAPSGALAGEPALVEARAASDGPAIMQAARAAITSCAPYSFLPRERYREWKVLDVGVSPHEMRGG